MSVGHLVILRYLTREILVTTGTITCVLLVIFLSSRLVRFLEQAASGGLPIDLVWALVLWRIPSSLELILPLALTLAVLTSISRMNADSELVVLQTSGCSTFRLFSVIAVPTVLIALVVASLAIVGSPYVANQLEHVLQDKDRLTALDTLVAGRFQNDATGRLIYADSMSDDRNYLFGVFISEPSGQADETTVISAQTGQYEVQGEQKFLALSNGTRYIGRVDSADWEVSEFERYLIRVEPEIRDRPQDIDTLSTPQLLKLGTPAAAATVGWRFSMPILVLMMMPCAFVVARSSPRQSRFFWMVPIMLMQFFYFIALTMMEDSVESGELTATLGFGMVHGMVLLFVVSCFVIARWTRSA